MSKQPERRRRFVRAFAPAVGLLAAGLLVWQGSYAAFNATTNNTGSTWGTATLQLQNNGGAAGTYGATTTAAFGGSNLKPAATASECLTVNSGGSTAGGNLAMYATAPATDNVTPAGNLLKQISVTITAIKTTKDIKQDCTDDAVAPATPTTFASLGAPTTVLAATTLNVLPANFAAATPFAINAGDKVAYQLTWTFNTTGTTAGDNLLQAKSASAGFTWELQ